MASTTPIVSQPQVGLLNNSHLHNINGGTFNNVAGDSHINNSFVDSSTNPFKRLHSFIAAGAMHDSNERFPQPKCHPSTRERVLQRILNWVESDSCERILWLSGSAGTGKSAIAQTVSECCKQNGRLAATFFFFRTSSERNTSERLVATLAYQIALFVPGAKEFIVKAIEDDLSVFSKDINSQLFQLIIRPLTLAAQGWDSTQQLLVIIDGLDECVDKRQQTDILSAICNAFMNHELPLRFLICSRPEHDIQMRFQRFDLRSATACLVLDMDNTVTQDIATFLEAEFSRIHREERIQETPWPSKGAIQSLAERATGQFIYASTVIKFIDDRNFQPQQRLDMVLGTVAYEMFSPFAELDLLYIQILDAVPVSKVEKTLLCLGVIIHLHDYRSLVNGEFVIDLKFLDQLFQINSGGVDHLLRELHSVLDVEENVAIRHKSFSDFLSCKTRSGRYHIDEEISRAEISGRFWAILPQRLNRSRNAKYNMSRSPLTVITQHWRDLLPESRHAKATLRELANIADLLEKKASDAPYGTIFHYLGIEELSDFYPTIISWLSEEKLDEQNPILRKQYISLFDKDILSLLKRVEFLDPIHSIHFLAFKLPWIIDGFTYVGMPDHSEVFFGFFSDPSRSGKYHLTPQHHADIVVWIIQYHYPLPRDILVQRFQCEAHSDLERLSDDSRIQPLVIPNDIHLFHLSHASRCAEQLIEIIRFHNPDTFPLTAQEYRIEKALTREFQEQYREKVRKGIARYLLDNSQMYGEWLAVKLEEDRKIQSSLTHKLGTVPLLHVGCYLFILAVYFKFQWVLFPLPDPRSCSP